MFDNYNIQLDKGLSVTGESRSYFAHQRVKIVADIISDLKIETEKILDFGCGDGSTLNHLDQIFHPRMIIGMDLENSFPPGLSRDNGELFQFVANENSKFISEFDLIYTNGVFHHIEPELRHENLRQVHTMLKPGGYFAFWENNPWNIGTRIVMSRIPFDKDVKKINVINARSLLKKVGFEIICIRFAFIFPNFMKFFRPLENFFDTLPLGGQYLILAKKPWSRSL